MSAGHDDQDIKSLEKEVEQCHAEEDRMRKWWGGEQRRYAELHPDQTHPEAGRYEAEMEHLERCRILAQKRLDEAKSREKDKDGLERGEPERRRGGRGR